MRQTLGVLNIVHRYSFTHNHAATIDLSSQLEIKTALSVGKQSAIMSEVSFAKQFLASLDSKPTKLSSDYVADPRKLPKQPAVCRALS